MGIDGLEELLGDEKKTPEEWSNEVGIKVVDPDGWRHDRFSWDEPITHNDFMHRMRMSTVQILKK